MAQLAAEGAEGVETIEKPIVPAWAMPYWSAWWRLRWDRDTFTSGIPFPIRFTSIDAYATRYGIGGHAFDTLLYLVREMDDEYVSIEANRVSPREDG